MAKTSGIEDLVKTLIKQHGIHESISRAYDQLTKKLSDRQMGIWRYTLNKLKLIRDQ